MWLSAAAGRAGRCFLLFAGSPIFETWRPALFPVVVLGTTEGGRPGRHLLYTARGEQHVDNCGVAGSKLVPGGFFDDIMGDDVTSYLADPVFTEPHDGPYVSGSQGRRDPSPSQIAARSRAIRRHYPRLPAGEAYRPIELPTVSEGVLGVFFAGCGVRQNRAPDAPPHTKSIANMDNHIWERGNAVEAT